MSTKNSNFTQDQLARIAALEVALLRDLTKNYVEDLENLLSQARTVYEFEGLLSKFYRCAMSSLADDLREVDWQIADLYRS